MHRPTLPALPCSRGYYWTQPVLAAEGNLYNAYAPNSAVNFTFELQICGPVLTKFPLICNNTNSAINVIDAAGTSCISVSDATVSAFRDNPYEDGKFAWIERLAHDCTTPSCPGANLDQYNGDAIDHVTRYSSRLYLTCAPTWTPPSFEHLKVGERRCAAQS